MRKSREESMRSQIMEIMKEMQTTIEQYDKNKGTMSVEEKEGVAMMLSRSEAKIMELSETQKFAEGVKVDWVWVVIV